MPNYNGLTDHVQGAEMQRAESVLTSWKKAGEALRGSYGHHPTLTTISRTTAVIADCLAVHPKIYNLKAGRLKMTNASGPFALSAEMVLSGSTWKVADIKPSRPSCAMPPPAPASSPDSDEEQVVMSVCQSAQGLDGALTFFTGRPCR